MSTEIICNTTGRETRVALLENGNLVELLIDRGDNRGYVGNVYLGKVVRVLPGMQAAFVDIGMERAAFLYVGDIHPQLLHLHLEDGEHPVMPQIDANRVANRAGQPPIQDLLKEGQEIVVQVAKDPIGTKGARLTTHIALPGRYLVFMPTVEHVGISRRIDKDKERRRLRDFVEKNRPKGAGFIVRTVCEKQPLENLKADIDYLLSTWEKIQVTSKTSKAPAVLHEDSGLVLRSVRDLFDDDISRMVVDEKSVYDDVSRFVGDFMPRFKDRVHYYRGAEPIFDTYGVETQIKRSLGRKVWLKSGGYLVIDQTEALMAIDVNSGKFVGTSSLEDTTLQINLEAVEEVVHQLRLRNMGGLIIIDLIDMDQEDNREKVYKALEVALRQDRARTNVLKISELGLVEMTRKRVQEGLDRYLTESCPVCGGTGVVRSRTTVCYDIFRDLRREKHRNRAAEQLFVNTTPDIADEIYSDHFDEIEALEEKLKVRVVVRALAHYHPEQYEVYGG
ncbi:MAG: Rne/Rng family ribonuclease [Deltaproteobacteria bacterium]|nr:Rne/Rng family ribonuclease [Deltaproteobacteria bacterium]